MTGEYGEEPKVTFKAPFVISKTQTKVISEGDGPAIKEGASVTVNYVGINGRTGKTFDNSFERGEPATFNLAQVVPGFGKGLTGQKQGSRVLIGITGPDGYDASGGNPQIDVQVGDTLLFVVDIVAVPLDGPGGRGGPPEGRSAHGDRQGRRPRGHHAEDRSADQLTVQPIIKGDGAKVAATDTITFNYRWYTWDGQLLEDSYKSGPRGVPAGRAAARHGQGPDRSDRRAAGCC